MEGAASSDSLCVLPWIHLAASPPPSTEAGRHAATLCRLMDDYTALGEAGYAGQLAEVVAFMNS